MKRLLLAFLALGLIAVGAIVDRSLAAINTPRAAVAAVTARVVTNANTTASSIDGATQGAYAIAAPSVVYVVSTGIGSGSGVIYDNSGDIVTNNHVVSGATSLTVTLNDGRSFPATVVGTDKADDLAVIRIHASALRAAHFALAGGYHVAQTVLAVGSPLGLRQSVTSGLISGVHRVEQEPNGAYLADAVQTSAPINPGNSGGALVALDGSVVGIPTLEQTSAQNGSAAQNIGFAIPSERVVLVASQIIASGKVQHTGRPYLGIAPSDAAGQSASPFGGAFGPNTQTPTVAGALVQQVASNGPAGRSGVHQGDVITGIDGMSVTSAQDLLTVLAAKKPGDTATLKINRSGHILTISVRLGELPA